MSAHFGLADTATVNEVRVEWTNGTVTTLSNVATNQTLIITVENPPGDLDGDCQVGIIDFLELLSQWGPCEGCPADLDGDGIVGILDFLSLLANWG